MANFPLKQPLAPFFVSALILTSGCVSPTPQEPVPSPTPSWVEMRDAACPLSPSDDPNVTRVRVDANFEGYPEGERNPDRADAYPYEGGYVNSYWPDDPRPFINASLNQYACVVVDVPRGFDEIRFHAELPHDSGSRHCVYGAANKTATHEPVVHLKIWMFFACT